MNSALKYIIAMLLLSMGTATTMHAQSVPTPEQEENGITVPGGAVYKPLSRTKIHGNVFGGGDQAAVEGNTTVNIYTGEFGGEIFGGGNGALNGDGTVAASADIGKHNADGTLVENTGDTHVNINGGEIVYYLGTGLGNQHNIYGGGNLACNVAGNTHVNMTKGMITSWSFVSTDVAASAWQDWYDDHKADQQTPKGAVFGAGFGANTDVALSTNVNISFGERFTGEIDKNTLEETNAYIQRARPSPGLSQRFVTSVLGGGYNGTVGAYSVDAKSVNRDKDEYDANTNVTIQGVPFMFNVFGGGLGSLEAAQNDNTVTNKWRSRVGAVYGGTKVDVQGGFVYGSVFGGGAGITGGIEGVTAPGSSETSTMPFINAAQVFRETDVTIHDGAIIIGNVYGGGDIANTGWYTQAAHPQYEDHIHQTNQSLGTLDYTTSLKLLGGNILGEVYGGGNGRLIADVPKANLVGAIIGSTNVTLGTDEDGDGLHGTSVWSNIYGGGKAGCVYSCAEIKSVTPGSGAARVMASGVIDGSTNVAILGGLIARDLFAGGFGDVDENGTPENYADDVVTSADVSGNTFIYFKRAKLEYHQYWQASSGTFQTQSSADVNRNTESDVCHNLYGGGNVACVVKGNSHVYMSGAPTAPDDFFSTPYYNECIANVAKPHFSAFGGGFGVNAQIMGNAYSDINLAQGTGLHSVIGGGMNGPVTGSTQVHVGNDPRSLVHFVYGGGYYAPCAATELEITRGTIMENVFGGAVMGHINADGALSDIATKTVIGLREGTSIDLEDENGTILRQYTYNDHQNQIIIGGNVYGGNDVSGTVNGMASLTIYGGRIVGNVYGAGNGDHIGYYEPGILRYDMGAHGTDNYYIVNHAGGPSGKTYISRPHTTGGVNLTLAGNSESERVTVLGQVFGGGNSCTIGQWDEDLGGDPHLRRDNPDYFLGGGQLNINLGSHITIGRTNAQMASIASEPWMTSLRLDASAIRAALTSEDGENVSGFYLGSSGAHLATQDKAKTDNYYHHYYDPTTHKYWPGFVVYADNGSTPLTRDEGIRSFNAYLNNILVWTDDVNLTIPNDVEDLFLANFVGGGFRGSMKTKTTGKKFAYTLPAGVTVGNLVVGGAYNTDVVYHIFSTSDGHTYTESDGHYEYLTNLGGLTQGQDYDLIEYGATDNVKGIIRFRYDGGILSSNGSNVDDFVTLDLRNKFAPGADETKARVFGGCFASGIIQGDAVVNYSAGNADGTQGAYDVYGGGALADIAGNTKVNLLGGVLTNAYGGGLGRLADNVKDYAPVAAIVDGNTTVQLGTDDGSASSIVKGSVFGANNVNGTPKGHAYVHVLRTTPQPGAAAAAYDVAAVYGGGNMAAYLPTSDEEFSEVLVENCDNSIEYVYGGGNAAPSPATQVTIRGGFFYDIFAGGNGAGDGNPGADVGYFDYVWDDAHKYGAGTSDAYIYSGVIADGVFGGSNTRGNVRTKAEVHIDDLSADTGCRFEIGEIYGAGNEAYMDGSSAIDLGCVPSLGVLYGGAKNANIGGNITLNITSGEFGQIFGGNNLGGMIMGDIVVNIDETGCYPIKINELYTCGNKAAYSVYGYNDDGTPKLSGDRQYADPQLNIYSCTSIGTVFGGGLGAAAVVAGNTNVTINQIPGRYADRISGNLGEIGTVFGGGNEARVVGETNVNVATSSAKVTHVLPYYNGTNGGHSVTDEPDATPYDAGANISGNIYGGGNQADVTGKTNVTIGR